MSVVRILVVDDFVPWQSAVKNLLKAQPGLQVIGFAMNGHEALEKVKQLAPDLILLDIEMPGMNGIEVARELGKLSPTPRIIFVSGTDAFEIVQKARETGASAFVHKLNASFKLIPAIIAAMGASCSGSQCR